jgi:hypothetical protein
MTLAQALAELVDRPAAARVPRTQRAIPRASEAHRMVHSDGVGRIQTKVEGLRGLLAGAGKLRGCTESGAEHVDARQADLNCRRVPEGVEKG